MTHRSQARLDSPVMEKPPTEAERAKAEREKRLAQALRTNLRRRKAGGASPTGPKPGPPQD